FTFSFHQFPSILLAHQCDRRLANLTLCVRLKTACTKRLLRRLAKAAKERLQELIDTQGISIWDSGERDRFKLPLVWVVMPDGRTAGSILIEEKLARIWTRGYKADWCPDRSEGFQSSPVDGRVFPFHLKDSVDGQTPVPKLKPEASLED
ncbi:MAG: hypothetical protein AAGA50_31230, partial [Pseudomonadota bacterium]